MFIQAWCIHEDTAWVKSSVSVWGNAHYEPVLVLHKPSWTSLFNYPVIDLFSMWNCNSPALAVLSLIFLFFISFLLFVSVLFFSTFTLFFSLFSPTPFLLFCPIHSSSLLSSLFLVIWPLYTQPNTVGLWCIAVAQGLEPLVLWPSLIDNH